MKQSPKAGQAFYGLLGVSVYVPMKPLRIFLWFVLAISIVHCRKEIPHSFAGAWQALPADLFGEAQGMAAHWSVQGQGGAVSSANALATEAGIEILKRGGNAIDALLAVQWVLAVVEPQSSGLGGGGFLLYYDAATKKTFALDGREEAPAAIPENIFLDAGGKPLPFPARIAGARAVGVPGTVALLDYAHRRFGGKKIPFAETFDRAVQLAEHGIRVSPRLAQAMRINRDRLKAQNGGAIPLLLSGEPYAIGEQLVQSELAATLKRLQKEGAADFYRGSIADDIAATVRGHMIYASAMTKTDLENYRVVERATVEAKVGNAVIYSVPAPASGAYVLRAITGAGPYATTRGDTALLMSSLAAQKAAFGAREKELEDPDFHSPPKAGTPQSGGAQNTTHVAIADSFGNVVSYTSSVETSLGSALFVRGRGFVLNNQLSDFNPEPGKLNSVQSGRRARITALNPEARETQGGKRPKSSMSPVIIRQPNGSFTALGSPGGPTIVGSVALVASRVLAGSDLQEAIHLPRALQMPNGKTLVELPLKRDKKFLTELKTRGFDADLRRSVISLGSVQAVGFNAADNLFTAASDLRREGLGLVVNPQVD